MTDREAPARYSFSYVVHGDIPRHTLPKLLQIIDRATVRHTGWSPFWVPTRDGIKPYIKDGAIECDLNEDGKRWASDPAHADFWRVSPDGKAFLARGYDEDSYRDRVKPGTVIDITLPVWRIGECLLQAASFTRLLVGEERDISFLIEWAGLNGRELTSVDRTRHVWEGRICRQDKLSSSFESNSKIIDDQLPELLFEILTPFYALFDFFELSKTLVDTEVQRLRSGRY